MRRNHSISFPFMVAWAIFATSMFLEGVDGFEGWRCAWFSIVALNDFPNDTGWSLYYFLFTIPNLAMLLSPLAAWRMLSRAKMPKASMIFAWCCAAYVMSFAIIDAADGGASELKIGYYLWAASFVILAGEWMRQTVRRNLTSKEIQPTLAPAGN